MSNSAKHVKKSREIVNYPGSGPDQWEGGRGKTFSYFIPLYVTARGREKGLSLVSKKGIPSWLGNVWLWSGETWPCSKHSCMWIILSFCILLLLVLLLLLVFSFLISTHDLCLVCFQFFSPATFPGQEEQESGSLVWKISVGDINQGVLFLNRNTKVRN